mgnify:CR=1 FL=1
MSKKKPKMKKKLKVKITNLLSFKRTERNEK